MIESFVNKQIVQYLEEELISIDQSTQTKLHGVIDVWLKQINGSSLTGANLLLLLRGDTK